MANTFEIQIQLTQETRQNLINGEYKLCVFQGVKSSSSNFVPVLMNLYDDYLQDTQLEFVDDDLGAYITNTPLVLGNRITALPPSNTTQGLMTTSSSVFIATSQKMSIGTNGNLTNSSIPESYIQLQNSDHTSYTTGLGHISGGAFSLFCAASINFQNILNVTPSNIFLFSFSQTTNLTTGIYLKSLNSSSMAVTASTQQTRIISYTMDNGWDANNATWATRHDPGSDLTDILVGTL